MLIKHIKYPSKVSQAVYNNFKHKMTKAQTYGNRTFRSFTGRFVSKRQGKKRAVNGRNVKGAKRP